MANVVLIVLNVLAYLRLSPLTWDRGPNSPPWTILTYGFVHAGWCHVLFKLWYLWVIGNPVNRRIGNGYYVATYLGTIVLLGILGRLLLPGFIVGASGAVFAIIAMMGMLMPTARVEVHYLAFVPVTVVMGMLKQAVSEMETFIEDATQETAKALAGEKKLQKELAHNQNESKVRQSRAEKAVDEGNDQAARDALARKQEHDRLIVALEDQLRVAQHHPKNVRLPLFAVAEHDRRAAPKIDLHLLWRAD